MEEAVTWPLEKKGICVISTRSVKSLLKRILQISCLCFQTSSCSLFSSPLSVRYAIASDDVRGGGMLARPGKLLEISFLSAAIVGGLWLGKGRSTVAAISKAINKTKQNALHSLSRALRFASDKLALLGAIRVEQTGMR